MIAKCGDRMSTIVVLAVCVDQFFPGTEASVWKSAGYFFIPAASIKEAIKHFKAGDFDLVLLGNSIPEESRERLTYLIRATVPMCLLFASPVRRAITTPLRMRPSPSAQPTC